MDEIKIIEVKQSVFEDNDKDAERLRAQLKKEKTFLLNLMSSPGSGKTTLLVRLAEELKDKIKMAVMEADIDSSVDAQTMINAGVPSIQIHTGGMCHLDADMTRQGLNQIGKDYDLEEGISFESKVTRTENLKHAEGSQVKYDLIGKIAEVIE